MLGACEGEGGESGAEPTGAGKPAAAAKPIDAAPPPDAKVPLFVHEAIRCAECHNKMHQEWQKSAHANAEKSPAYRKMRKAASDESCGDRCHAPLRRFVPTLSAVDEGATCDVCHTVKGVDITEHNAALDLGLDDMIRYGPLCDAKNHYFHRMGCSELHTQAKLCAGCHHMYWPTKGGKHLPVLTTWEEWKAQGRPEGACQACHMPGSRAEVATGAGKRDRVPDHSFMGKAGTLRGKAVALEVKATTTPTGVGVAATVANVGSGHSVPSGVPARRLAVIVKLIDAGGTVHEQTRSFGRFLVDDAGKPAAFPQAARMDKDNRIASGKSAVETFDFTAADGTLTVVVEWRSLDPDIAKAIAADVRTEVLAKVTIPVKKLPKTVRAGAKRK